MKSSNIEVKINRLGNMGNILSLAADNIELKGTRRATDDARYIQKAVLELCDINDVVSQNQRLCLYLSAIDQINEHRKIYRCGAMVPAEMPVIPVIQMQAGDVKRVDKFTSMGSTPMPTLEFSYVAPERQMGDNSPQQRTPGAMPLKAPSHQMMG